LLKWSVFFINFRSAEREGERESYTGVRRASVGDDLIEQDAVRPDV